MGRDIQNTEMARGPHGGDTYLEVPVSCDSQPVAGPTKMLRHGCDEADVASEARDFKGLRRGRQEGWRKRYGWRWVTECQLSLPDIRALTS